MSRLDALNYISHGIAKVIGQEEERTAQGADEDSDAEKVVRKGREALDAYCVDLNKKAAEGRIDPLIGRIQEIERTIQVLCRRTKNNPLYVGEAGVGKTAIAEGLARRIVQNARRPSSPSTWGRCWPARAIGATSRSGSRRWSRRSRRSRARSCSSTRSIR
jgi:ATP-dependent Clp protease ATP-binding subunit ClpA